MPRNQLTKRLRDYDYSTPGAYFVTICAHQRHLYFEHELITPLIEEAWHAIPNHFPSTATDEFVVMPNHVHGIIMLGGGESVGTQHAGVLQAMPSLSTIVRSFKSAVTRELRLRSLWDGTAFWQSNFYDRVVRNEDELARIRDYIAYNPIAWRFDHENPDRDPSSDHDKQWAWIEGREL